MKQSCIIIISKGQERTRPNKSPRNQDFEMAYEHIKQIFTFESVHQDMYMYYIELHFLTNK